MNTLLLSRAVVEANTHMSALIPAIEDAFAAYERGNAQMPSKTYIDLPQYNGDFRSMPAYLKTDKWDAAGVKWVNVHPDNPDQSTLPTVMGVMIYSDPSNAFPLAVMDGTELTRQRTGAAAAVATDHLAVTDASSLGIVGAGVQSYTQLEAISVVRPIDTVIVRDLNGERLDRFISHFSDQFDVHRGSIRDAAQCDVVSTVTPVESPIVSLEDVGDQTHINAIGADAAGKHELDDDLLRAAKLVIDDCEQCTSSGEINVPWNTGTIVEADLHGEIGELVVGTKSGRTTEDGITIFDSTGLAIQDVAAAHIVYEHALENENGVPFDLLGLE